MGKRISHIIAWILTALFLYELVTLAMEKNWLHTLVSFGAIAAVWTPFLLKRIKRFNISNYVIWGYFAFLFLSMYLGTILDFYSLGWWDFALHIYSGALLVLIGQNMLEDIERKSVLCHYRPSIIFWFLLSFGVFGGVLWEIYEFSIDTFFGTDTQGGGNRDTMTDLVADTLGALILAIIFYIVYHKRYPQFNEDKK